MRLNAYLAKAGIASRRGADILIKAGRVTVNGKQGQLSENVSDNDKVFVDNNAINSQKNRYILLNKPTGYLTTLKDPHGRRKVMDLVSVSERVVPVGRLDYDTTGALLLTNDGGLAHMLMHPSFNFTKTYIAKVVGNIGQEKLDVLSNSVRLEDGPTFPAVVRQISDNTLELTIHEGRNHQVKRMLAAVDLPVQNLHRSKYGPLDLAGLKVGEWRDLTDSELQNIRNFL